MNPSAFGLLLKPWRLEYQRGVFIFIPLALPSSTAARGNRVVVQFYND
jgi:hypothetical protein